MPVPKKRQGKSAQGHRRSQWKATLPTTAKCQNCNEEKLAHTVCSFCGYYGSNEPASKKLKEE